MRVEALGQVPAVSMLLAAALGLVVGPLAERFGHRRTIALATLAAALGAAGTALTSVFPLLFVTAALIAAGRAVVAPVSLALVGTRFDGDARRRAVSWIIAATSGAAVLGVPALTTVAAPFGWRAAFGLLAVCAAGLVVWLLPAGDRDGVNAASARAAARLTGASVIAGYLPILRHPPSLGIYGASLLRNVGVWSVLTYFGALLVQQYALGSVEVGWAFMAAGAGHLIGSVVLGRRLSDRSLRPVLAGLSVLLTLCLGTAALLAAGPLVATAALTLGAFFAGGADAATATLLTRDAPGGRATAMTLNGSAQSLGWALGSSLGGLLLAIGGFAAIGAAVPVFGLLAAVLLVERHPRPAVQLPSAQQRA